jgi:polar amino acid transport system substrate-binding protein
MIFLWLALYFKLFGAPDTLPISLLPVRSVNEASMRSRFAPTLAALVSLAALLPTANLARPMPGELRALVFDDGLPFVQKQGDTYEGLAVDVLNAIKDEAGATTLTFITADDVEDGLQAITSGRADIACGVAFTWGRAKRVLYTLPFAIGGTRLLAPAGVDGTPESLSGRTVGVLEDSASAETIASVVPAARLSRFRTPAEALAALNSNKVQILAGPSLWLAANRGTSDRRLVPAYPYGRSGMSCIVAQNNPGLLTAGNLAIVQMMQAYVDGDAGTRHMVNRWVGPESTVKLSEDTISAFYQLMIAATAEISTTVKPPDTQAGE